MAKSTPARTKKARGARKDRPAGARPGRTTRSASATDAANAWRQRVSKDAAETIDTVVAHVQAVAEQQLGQHGAFPAFLVTARKDGEYELDALPPEQVEELSPESALEALREKAEQLRDEILCAGVAFPVTLPDRSGQTAVAVEVQHREGESLRIIQPYRVKGAERSVSFGDVTAEPADPWLWL
jgi:L-lactate utilization protein LutC